MSAPLDLTLTLTEDEALILWYCVQLLHDMRLQAAFQAHGVATIESLWWKLDAIRERIPVRGRMA